MANFSRCGLAGLVTLLGHPALAQDGRWSLIAESGGCEVSFVEEMVDDGIFFVDRHGADCGPDIGRITGYALNDEGATVVLYSTLAGVEVLGRATLGENGVFAGALRKGGVLRLEHRSGSRVIADPAGEVALEMPADDPAADTEGETGLADGPDTQAEPAVQPTGPCIGYAGQGEACAEAADLGPPESGMLQVLTRMNLRDQGTTQGSSVIGRVEAGTCLTVTFCSEDEQGRLWCGVQGDGLQGYVLKQDAQTVYSRNSCR